MNRKNNRHINICNILTIRDISFKQGLGTTRLIILLLGIFGFASCSVTRNLNENQVLFTGNKISIEPVEENINKGEITPLLQQTLPQPNEKILGWRYRAWFYTITPEEPKRKIGKWLKNRIGRPPALLGDQDLERNIQLLNNRLFNNGYFDPQIEYQIEQKNKKGNVKYIIALRPPLRIKELSFFDEPEIIAVMIDSLKPESRLQEQQVYNLENIKRERERINTLFRDEGYYFFNPDFLIARADTNNRERTIILNLDIKENIPSKALNRYSLGDIRIYNQNMPGDTLNESEPTPIDTATWVYNNTLVDNDLLRRSVFFDHGKLYNSEDHNLTLRRFNKLGIYKFVNFQFQEKEGNMLDLNIYLTPMEKKNLSAELRGVSKSNNFAGPGLSVSFSNRNLLGGAEHLNIDLDANYEFLPGNSNVRSIETGGSVSLEFPELIVPFEYSTRRFREIPKTITEVSVMFLSRTDAFNLTTSSASWGYQWQRRDRQRHRLSPFVFELSSLGNLSENYENIFARQVLLRSGLFEQFLAGAEYSFFFNTIYGDRSYRWYFNYNLDVAGNLAGVAESVAGNELKVFGQNFAQFAKTDFDLRFYQQLRFDHIFAARFIAGIGIPYGNSDILPFTKLFTAGGSNSIRAFAPRSLGPGTYVTPDSIQSSFNIYQTGEIKLELSAEYRHSFSNIIKGAAFIDAGNIWDLSTDENTPGGKFNANDFLNQIAIATGAGIRFDFTFFILRLDLAFPIAIPYHDEDTFIDLPQFGKRDWRREFLILNLAIGYPF